MNLAAAYRAFGKGLGVGFQAPSTSRRPASQRVYSVSKDGPSAGKAPMGRGLAPKRMKRLKAPSLGGGTAKGLDGMQTATASVAALKRSLADEYRAFGKSAPETVLTHRGAPKLRTRPLRAVRAGRWRRRRGGDTLRAHWDAVGY